MESRQSWQALQSRIGEARTALNTGDRVRALQALDAALLIDPGYLVAQAMRAQLLEHKDLDGVSPATPTPPPLSTGNDPSFDLVAFAEKYARLEERARQRRILGLTASVRGAIGRSRFHDAAVAMHEIRALDPMRPELTHLADELEAARRLQTPLSSPAFRSWTTAALLVGAVFTAIQMESPQTVDTDQPPTSPEPVQLASPIVPGGDRSEPQPAPESPSVSATSIAVRDEPESIRSQASSLAPLTLAPTNTTRANPVAAERSAAAARVVLGTSGPTRREPSLTIASVPEAVFSASEAPSLPAEVTATELVVPLAGAGPGVPIDGGLSEAAASSLDPVAATGVTDVGGNVTDDAQRIREVLQRYRSAYDQLDAESASAVWPAVNQRALARAFGDLESQTLTFRDCDVEFEGGAATAICRGTTRFVPKVGSREPHVEARRWSFSLKKFGADWMIENARAER